MTAPHLERLGSFYLGRGYNMDAGEITADPLLYDAKDLTTHAVCVGMTGSGKTGLCVSLLEEAAIDGVPAIVIDPKGDIGNLCLTFPNLSPEEFRPWIDTGEAAREGMDPDQYAAHMAKLWQGGLAQWDQDAERIKRLKAAAEVSIYTPGSSAGRQLTVLRSFNAPPQAVLDDSDAMRERITSAASGLLALLGIDADPINSREHILVSNLLDRAWREGRNLDIAGLIRDIQTPPFDRVGFLDLESFYPEKDRTKLAISLNNLLASPGFSAWLEGEPMNIQRLLYTPEGKPRIAIVSIAHLSDTERMFLVTILLNEVLAWVRSQPGTSSLRALLYMDEVFGFFPPTANPPAKKPMLTLLKQARAFGLGVVLATQNPVDLDYKGLSNTGTWFLGRLQTERDKARVLEGLEGASAQAGSTFDKQAMEQTLAGLGKRVFLMNNVHEDAPVVFHTRWALSYLRGPLTRTHIQKLMKEQKAAAEPPAAAGTTGGESASNAAVGPAISSAAPADKKSTSPAKSAEAGPPKLPKTVKQKFLAYVGPKGGGDATVIYRPTLIGVGRVHYVRVTYKVDEWRTYTVMADAGGDVPKDPWDEAAELPAMPELDDEPVAGAAFAKLDDALTKAASYKSWGTKLKAFLYADHDMTVYKCGELKQYSEPGESEGDFRVRLRQLAFEERDLQKEKLRKKYASKLETLKKREDRAEEELAEQQAQSSQSMIDSAISFGTTIMGAMFGRKLASKTNVDKFGTAARSAGKAARERSDVTRAQRELEAVQEDILILQEEMQESLDHIQQQFAPENLELEELTVRPRKTDMDIEEVALAWAPWLEDKEGVAEPAYVID